MTRKLSDLIEEGSKLAPQAFEAYVDDEGCTCAIGAAYHALTGEKVYYVSMTSLCKAIGHVFDVPVHHPVDTTWDDVFQIVYELNDKYKWTREQIVEWLRSINL